MSRPLTRTPALTGFAVLATALLAACGGADASSETETATRSEETRSAEPTQTDHAEPRAVVAYPDHVAVMDAEQLTDIASFDVKNTPYLAPAADGRHVFALQHTEKLVRVVDAGSWTESHGDHGHSYVVEPSRPDLELKGTSYHAVSDDERTVVWDDDAGNFDVVEKSDLEDGTAQPKTIDLKDAHHGVAVPLHGGGYLASFSADKEAAGVEVLDADGKEVDKYDGCPHLHGEAHLGESGYAFGCADGIMVVDDTGARKIASPVPGAGTGHLIGDGSSPVLAGTLSSEADDPTLANKIALYDTAAGSAKVVDLGVAFSRLASAEGNAVVIGTDGNLHVVNLASGEIKVVPAIAAWTAPEDFLEPRPQIALAGDQVWVTDPMAKKIVVVDLTSGETVKTADVKGTPDQIAIVNYGSDGHQHG